MDHEMIGKAEPDAEILTFDVSDAALEQAAGPEQRATTWIYCTNFYGPTGGRMPEDVKIFRVTPIVISVLDYSKGFGHTDLVTC
jgi:hypothetical protein